MYLNSNREKLIKYILSVSGIFSVTLSLYLSVSFYFSDFDKFLTFQTHKAYLLILVGQLFYGLWTYLNPVLDAQAC